jgi:hypothetical protein
MTLSISASILPLHVQAQNTEGALAQRLAAGLKSDTELPCNKL